MTVIRALLLAVSLTLFVAACSGDSTSETTTGAQTKSVRVYFLRDGKVWPVHREIATGGVWNPLLLEQLRRGPTKAERALGLTSEVPQGDTTDLSAGAGAQLVYTMTQFPAGDTTIEVGGIRYTRADFEEQTPSILVESPLAFEKASSPLRVTGTANTFEATFDYEMTDTDGKIVDSGFVTATSGSGTRGTFDFTTKPYTVPFDGVGELIVFERSAKDGSRIHLAEIPLSMKR